MKISEAWLREWIGPVPGIDELCHTLNMAGLEVEERIPAALDFSGVVVATVLAVEPHPQADRLRVCQVDDGSGSPKTIVCGASNVVAGMRAPLARVGATLPGDLTICASRLRGVMSEGMLCSSSELGLGDDEVKGILPLPDELVPGAPLREALSLDDTIIDISVTPNRGDCLSVAGLSREIAALTGHPLKITLSVPKVPPVHEQAFPVRLEAPEACSRYVGRVIRKIDPRAKTPLWIQERLRRAGHRSISLVVDITNYVMLECGQPMHAFDLQHLTQGIHVRVSRPGESLHLLDDRTITLDGKTLLIADEKGPLAIAGVMGGKASSVTTGTDTLFLESAWFHPEAVAYSARHTQTTSESSYRFERGVDPVLQREAMERATALILEYAGGEAGPIVDIQDTHLLPEERTLTLHQSTLNRLAGMTFEPGQVTGLLKRPHFVVREIADGWQVTVPPRRFDLKREEDLVEEVLRLLGYQNIPVMFPCLEILPDTMKSEKRLSVPALGRLMTDRGYHEVITYSFVDQSLQVLFSGEGDEIQLENPMTSGMGVMRKTLWPGLVTVLQHNLNRQQPRVRLFETGKRFVKEQGCIFEQPVLSGIVSGPLLTLQWAEEERETDFYDVKGDIEYLFSALGLGPQICFQPGICHGLHPGQTADIFYSGQWIGRLGTLHPKVMQMLDLAHPAILFEILTDSLINLPVPVSQEISRFPMIRRDLAILLDRSVPAKAIQDIIMELGDELLQSVTLFDIWQGKGVETGKRSVALALVMQHAARTLTDEEVDTLMQRIFSGLKENFGAELRG